MPKVTIIVSVHNPGKYLTPCLNSIINQTFQNIEVLLIDDGSTDGSRQILKDYESRDARITTIFRRKSEYEKFGQKYSADLGCALARGNYLLMMDHDDELMPDAIENLYKATDNETIDVVQGRSTSINENNVMVYHTPNTWPQKTTIKDINALNFDLQCFHLVYAPIAVWACLIRKELANKLTLIDCVFNDADYIWRLKIASNSFRYIPNYIYEHHHHEDSVSGKKNANVNSFHIFTVFKELEKFLKEQGASQRLWQLFTMYKFRMLYGQGDNLSPELRIKYMQQVKEAFQFEFDITNYVEILGGPEAKQAYQELIS